jgi:CubicO group peptidase (beta-lactamase class C family)
MPIRSHRRHLLLALLAPLAPAPDASAQATAAAPAYARVDSAVLEELRRTQTPGAAVALVSRGVLVYARGFGRSAADSGSAPVTPATLFRIASMTKVFTAAALVGLAEAGRVDLAAPLDARLAGELPEPFRRLTPHQLLSHTGGLAIGPIPPGGSDPATALAEAARRAPARAVIAPPGEIFSYSNLGYLLAGRAIEVAAGRPYAEQVRTTLLDPLGMRATTFDAAAAARAGAARGFGDTATTAAAAGVEAWPFAGLHSNVLELSRFAIAFMDSGWYQRRRVILPATIARIATPVAPFQSGEGDYGYGVRLYRHRGVDVVEHGGFGPAGFRSLLYMVPSHRVAVIVLANRAGRRPYAIADAALDVLLPPGALEPAAAATPAWVAMDSAEMARYVGRYANSMVIEVAVDAGALTLRQGSGAAMTIRKRADGRFVAGGDTDGAGNWVAFIPGPDGALKYLHFNMRAFRRQ